jgi:alpha-1,2-mannosyltransferase
MKLRLTRSHVIITLAIPLAAAYITAFFPNPDVSVYYSAGRSLLAGRTDLYAADFANAGVMDYRYPPVFVLLFVPFALLPFTAATFLWASFGLASAVAAFKQVAAIASEFLQTYRLKLVLFLASLLSIKYLLIALKTQNVHLILVAAVLMAFCLVLKDKLMPAALLIALTIAVKAFVVLLLPYFAIKRQWRLLGMTAGFVLMFLLLPSYYFGINGNIDLHQEWYAKVVNETDFYELNGPPSLSVQGQAKRFLTTVDYEGRVLDRAYANVNTTELKPQTAKLIGNVIAAAIALITFAILFFVDRRRRNELGDVDQNNRLALHEFGFLICMILLVGPRTNNIYFVAMFVPFVALLSSLFQKRSIVLWSAIIIATLASVILPLVPGAKAQRLFLVLGVDMFSTLAVWAALGWVLIKNLTLAKKQDHLP